jgi:hypothetical protein
VAVEVEADGRGSGGEGGPEMEVKAERRGR